MLNILKKKTFQSAFIMHDIIQILLPTPNMLGVNNCEPCAQNI